MIRQRSPMKVGERIRQLRSARRISSDQLASQIGESASHLLRIESSEIFPPIETAKKIAQALGVPLHHLFFDGYRPPPLPNLQRRKIRSDIAKKCSDFFSQR